MIITVKSKKELEQTIKKLRNLGYNIITLGKMFAELEKGDKIVTVTK